MLGRISSFFGPLSTVSKQSTLDVDAQAFIVAANITDSTQKSAINQLVVDLKSYGIWSKMKAIYPMIGGSAASHKWNLKDPRDLDAAFRLVFSGGWTHTSTGAKPNGTNGYADTYLVSSSQLSQDNTHISYYSRTNSTGTEVEFGASSGPNATDPGTLIEIRTSTITYFRVNSNGTYITYTDADSRAFYIANRTGSSLVNGWRNNIKVATGSVSSNGLPTRSFWLGGFNSSGVAYYSTKECSFASIGEGLTDTEATNFYTAVQKYQTTLARWVGTPIVSDIDAQAFLNAAEISDLTQATAINKLVIDMKAYGIWNKMKAIYPMVGGSAASHKWNLKDPRDLDAAFRLTFNGGWTHSATGAKPNGTNGYADTFLKPFDYAQNSFAFGCYLRNTGSYNGYMGAFDTYRNYLLPISGSYFAQINSSGFNSTAVLASQTIRLHAITRTTSTTATTYINGTLFFNDNVASDGKTNRNIYLGQLNNASATQYNSDNEHAFDFISDGLTGTEIANLTTAVNTYQTTLNRNV